MFGAILTVGVTGLVAYVLWRAASVPLLARRLSRRGFVLLGAGLVAIFFLGRTLGHGGTGPVRAALDWAGMNLLGSIFFVSVALFAVELATVFGLLLSRWAPALRGWAIAAGGLLSAIALVQGQRAPEVVSHEVTLPSLPRAYPLLAGRYDVDGMPVIVSRGSGTWGPRMRLWKRGEILKVTLRASGAAGDRTSSR